MGNHLDKLKRLHKLLGQFQKPTEELLDIAKEVTVKGKPDEDLSAFAYYYAALNYYFSIYLLSDFSNAVNKDKIDKEFKDMIKKLGENDER